MNKCCTNCNKSKNISEFHKETKGKFGVRSICKICRQDIAEKYREKLRVKKGTLSNKTKISDKIGRLFLTVEGYKVEIINCTAYKKCSIKFEDGFILHNINYNDIEKGTVKNPYHKSVYGVGYIGFGFYDSKKDYKIYKRWNGSLERCYSAERQKRQPTYIDVTVCEEWHNFQNFAKWHEENWKEYMVGWDLDKDILLKSNKIYSPKTCCFVPKQINSLFVKNNINRGEYPIGVSLSSKENKFSSFIRKDNKTIFLGYFDTPEEAFQAYKIAKESYIKEVADKWRGQITEQTYEAMYNYKVEITD